MLDEFSRLDGLCAQAQSIGRIGYKGYLAAAEELERLAGECVKGEEE